MATNTMIALDKVTLGSNAATVTFSNIPQTYTDLVLIVVAKDSNNYTGMRLNNSSATNYSRTIMTWNGSSTGSSRTSNDSTLYVGGNDTNYEVTIYNFQQYANTNVYKTIIGTQKIANATSLASANLWRSFSAINEIDIYSVSGTTLLAGSTFSLYGIKAEGASGTKATGGAVYSDSTYFYHVFGATGTFTPTQSLTADVLVVAGGGSSGLNYGGGGGAGGVTYYASQSLSATGYTCTVGAGGAALSWGSWGRGNNGSGSQFGALTASDGGGGGGYSGDGNGKAGGSGGGAAGGSSAGTGGSGVSGQGNAGGSGATGYYIGGGGGAGAAGKNGTYAGPVGGGNGTSAYSSWLSATGIGENVGGTWYIAGGGAGGNSYDVAPGTGPGGYGGGGGYRESGKANTGGGAGNDTNTTGGGGSGVIIVRYAK